MSTPALTSAGGPTGPAEHGTAAPVATSEDVLRVEKGHADPEELAAITAVLLARAAAGPSVAPDAASSRRAHSKAGWRRLERTPGFRAPHSWQG